MRTAVPEHAIPAGPLGVRWHAYALPPLRAGVAMVGQVELENAGTAIWQRDTWISYHWLDPLGNAIVWEGLRAQLPRKVRPGDRVEVDLPIRAPHPPGRYWLAIDLVEEGRFWFAEVGNATIRAEVEVPPRLLDRRLAVELAAGDPALAERTREALARQEVPIAETGGATAYLVPGVLPPPDWSARVLAAHDEGYAWVAGSLALAGSRREVRHARAALADWTPGFGRMPTWRRPLLCPSVVVEYVGHMAWLDPVAGLPALEPRQYGEPWLMDGTIELGLDAAVVGPAG